MKRLAFLDCMRGLAVLLVMLMHFTEDRLSIIIYANHNYFQLGQAGVVLFFLISGYIIPRSISSAISVREFWIHRIFRLFPIYWISILLAGIFTWLSLMHLPPGITIHEVLLNFSMLQGFLGAQNVIGVFWSLKFELVFYFLMTAIALTHLLKYSVFICLSYSIGIASIAIWMHFIQGKYFAYGLFHIQLMLIGWVVSEAHTGTNSRLQTSLAIVVGVLVTVLAAFTSFYGRGDTSAGGTLAFTPMLDAWLFGLFAFLAAVSFRESTTWPRWLSWIGRVSYSAYLLHVLVLFVLTPVVRDWGLFALPILFAASLSVAWVGYRFVELPSIVAGKRVANYWSSGKTNAQLGVVK